MENETAEIQQIVKKTKPAGKFGTDLTEGSVTKMLIRFATPFLISNIIQSLYSVADMLIVGRFSGIESMSGVNIGGHITFILTNIVFGLCSGATILIGQYMGAGKKEQMKKTTATIFTVLIVAAVIITSIMFVLKEQILVLIKTPESAFSEADAYLTVTLTGIIFIFAYNVLSAIMRGMGDSKRPLFFITAACITNVVLDLIFIGGFKMGAFGAALATVISQALSMILCIIYMKRNDFMFDFKPKSFRIHKEPLKMIFKIGTPSMIQNSVTSISFLLITVIVNKVGGVTASAAVGAVGKFNGFAIMPAFALGASISTMCAQNIGAGRLDRAVKACRTGVLMASVIGVGVFILAQIFADPIIRVFDDDPAMIESGVAYLRSFSYDYLIVPFVFGINGLFLGGGHTLFSLTNSLMSSILLRVPVSYIFGIATGLGITGVGFGAPAASLGSLLFIIGFLFTGKWKTNVVKHHAVSELE